MLGKPRHYVRGTLAGLATAMVAGALQFGFRIGFFGLIGSILLGYVIGIAVMRASARQRHSGIRAAAAVSCAAGLCLGAILTGIPFAALVRGPSVLPIVVTSAAAAFFAGR